MKRLETQSGFSTQIKNVVWWLLPMLLLAIGPVHLRGQDESTNAGTEREAAVQQEEEGAQSEDESEVQAEPVERPATGRSRQRGAGRAASEAATPNAPRKPRPITLESDWLQQVPWRSIGPANMGGRITAIDVHQQDKSLWWVATASGGLLKTNNRGTTVEHQFDQQTSVSIGAVASDPQNPGVVWVGTGEINPRNSVSYGDGVYKSLDGGKTFQNMGLEETYQISRILVHPTDSNTVYVGAQGRLYGPNEERGVYKTTDGGQTWEKVFYLDERTGVIDMIMHPEDPETLIVGMWDRLRDEFDSWPGNVPKPDGIDGYDPIRKWGPKAGLYKTADGGKNWKKLTQGLPSGMTGRIGLDWQSKSPHTIYAIMDCENIGKGPAPFNPFLGLVGINRDGVAVITQVMPNSPAARAGAQAGDVIKEIEGNAIFDFDDLLEVLRRKVISERIRLTLLREGQTLEIAPKLTGRPGTRPADNPQPFFGITGKDDQGKVVLTAITPGGPAEIAGLQVDDVVLKMNDNEIANYQSWINQTREMAIGDELQLEIQRGEELLAITAVLGKRERDAAPVRPPVMGIQGENASGGGARLTTVTEGGPAAKAGLKADDVITRLGEQPVTDYQMLVAEIRKLKSGDSVKVELQREDATVNLIVVLEESGESASSRPYTFQYFGQRANIQDQQGAKGYEYGGVYKSTDAGETWLRVNSLNVRPMYFSVVKVDPSDDQRVYLLGVSQYRSEDGGVTFTTDFGRGVHADCHDLWIDPDDGRHMIIGSDGGFYVSYDRGRTWDHVNTTAVGQFYHVTIAPKDPYWVYGGLQDNGSWGGPAIGKSGGTLIQDWINVGGGDGFVCRADPNDPDLVYSESQNGSIRRRNLRTGESASIRPPAQRGVVYRFNWNTPFILSSHNSRIFYSAGNYVFRSLDRGNNLQAISPEITRTARGSATALAESPRDPQVLYAGTDDGYLWRTKDGGQTWDNITENLGVSPKWVATIEPSRERNGRVYVCLDAHRVDDDRPYVFVSEDFGDTFESLSDSLPRGSSRCLREDIVNPNLLYLGTEFAFWVSLDRGQTWARFNQKLPTVAVHEVAMHPAVNEIVLATHGRSLWAADVSGLRRVDSRSLVDASTLYPPANVIRWRREPGRGQTNRSYQSQNPETGARLWYSIAGNAGEISKAVIRVENITGNQMAEIAAKTQPGLHSVVWNLTQTVAPRGQAGQGGTAGQGGATARPVPSGDYRVSFLIDDKVVSSQVLSLQRDPSLPADALSEEELIEAEWLEMQRLEEEQQVERID
jgi:S1-C subfamily serine protease/photosystem II stability/assembly factor-like uncharacterized protein